MALLARWFFGACVALPGLLVAAEVCLWLLGVPVLPIVERWTGPWCHYDPARTLTLGATLFPVCARCTGLYLGLMIGPVLGVFLPREGHVLARVAVAALAPMVLGLLAAASEALGLVSTSNATRLFLGLLLTAGPMALGMVGARIVGEALAGLTA